MGQSSKEDIEDLQAVRRFRLAASRGREELVPEIVLKRLLDGVSPLRVWREYRNLSLEQLAYLAGVDKGVVFDIENGKPPISDVDMVPPPDYRTAPSVSAKEQSPVPSSSNLRGMFNKAPSSSPLDASLSAVQTSYSDKLARALRIDPEDLLEW